MSEQVGLHGIAETEAAAQRGRDRDTITDIAFNRSYPRHVREIARGMLRADEKDRQDRNAAQALWDRGWRPTDGT